MGSVDMTNPFDKRVGLGFNLWNPFNLFDPFN